MRRRETENSILPFRIYSLITPVQILTHCCRTNRHGKVLLDFLLSLDPHTDPHGEMSGRKQWNVQAATSSFLEQKCPKALWRNGLKFPKLLVRMRSAVRICPAAPRKAPEILRFQELFFLSGFKFCRQFVSKILGRG